LVEWLHPGTQYDTVVRSVPPSLAVHTLVFHQLLHLLVVACPGDRWVDRPSERGWHLDVTACSSTRRCVARWFLGQHRSEATTSLGVLVLVG